MLFRSDLNRTRKKRSGPTLVRPQSRVLDRVLDRDKHRDRVKDSDRVKDPGKDRGKLQDRQHLQRQLRISSSSSFLRN